MHGSTRSLPRILIPVLLTVAIVGCVIGIRTATGSSPAVRDAPTRSASVANILFDYPSSWQPVTAAAPIPGLDFAKPIVLAPGGRSAQAGLIAGQLAGTEQSPLPARLLALLRGIPHAEVVEQPPMQAYRYTHLQLPGGQPTVELYVIPNQGENPSQGENPNQGQNATALACYAAPGFTAFLRQCEQIVAGLVPPSAPQEQLTPDQGYGRSLAGTIQLLRRERQRLRSELGAPGKLALSAHPAAALADRYAAAAAAVAKLEAPAAAESAQAALSSALTRARAAYQALAGAGAPASYHAAEGHVRDAEAAVNAALTRFSLLGYG